MGLELGLWRVDGSPIKLVSSALPFESQLETMIEQDSSLLGSDLLLIGRQVLTDFGKFIDLLGIDVDGTVHVLELKRDRTPRDVVAQLLDYGSWVQSLTNSDIRGIWQANNPTLVFDVQFAERFGEAPPDQLNQSHELTIVASGLDTSTERIVTYLRATHRVPINAVFFRYFVDGDRTYLARTWLIDDTKETQTSGKIGNTTGTTAPWNGVDWYVSFGEEAGGRSWDDARKNGFVSAGGGDWYSRTLRNLPLGARVFTFIPGNPRGYVGVGTVSAIAVPAADAVVEMGGIQSKFSELALAGNYEHATGDGDEGKDLREYIVAVAWELTVPRSDGVWQAGMFANQNSACKLRSQFTIDAVSKAFALDE